MAETSMEMWYVRSPVAFVADSICWPPLVPGMLTKARTYASASPWFP
ncbi:MAG TPA: hypothetical protein VH639_24515 [Bryobacteraceae bacterium]